MAKLRPYLSLDLETTGLDVKRVQILQIGWVIEDGVSPVKDLPHGSLFIKNDKITYGEDYAIGMNAWIFQELMKKTSDRKYPAVNLEDGILNLLNAIMQASKIAHDFDVAQGEARPSTRIQIAGKNAGVFDFPIVLNNIEQNSLLPMSESALKKVDHKFIDVGDLYFKYFGKNVGFDKIQKLIDQPVTTHDALKDAFAVVIAIRHLMNLPTK